MGRATDRTLLGIEFTIGLIFFLSLIHTTISRLLRTGHIRNISDIYLATVLLGLLLFYGFIFVKMKKNDFYIKHLSSIRVFVYGIIMLLLSLPIELYSILHGMYQQGTFLSVLLFISSPIISLIIFTIELKEKISTGKVLIIILLIVVSLSLFLWPKPCGSHTSVFMGSYNKCDCFGIWTFDGMEGGGTRYCLGICKKGSCEIVRPFDEWNIERENIEE